MSFAVGSLVKARGREWVVLPETTPDTVVARPLGGGDEEVAGFYLPVEPVEPASFRLPDPGQVGDYRSGRLLRDALRLGFRSSAGPFRSFARLGVEPRPYQLVPLLMALKLDPVRLLIADDVGVGKTVEAGLIVRELIDRGEVRRFAVLCPPQIAEQWQAELHAKFHLDAELVLPGTVSRLEKACRMFPLCGRGDVNTYTLFVELNRNLINLTGRVGCIVPTGIATDDTTKLFFQDLVEHRSLASLFGFENEEFLFPGVHHSMKFCLVTLAGQRRPSPATDFAFFARQVEQLAEPNRRFTLSVDDLTLMSPNTRTCPVFRTARDAELTKAIYRRVPVLLKEGMAGANPWGVSFLRMLDMATDSGLFRTAAELGKDGWRLDGNVFRKGDAEYLPLYEAKMLHHYDHRWGTYEGQTEAQANQGKLPELTAEQHADPGRVSLPRYWVPASEVADRLKDRWNRGWLIGWRDVCRNTDRRTMISTVLPRSGVGDKFLLMFPNADSATLTGLIANHATFVFDYVTRQKLGGTALKYFVTKQLPVLPPGIYAQPCPWDLSLVLATGLRRDEAASLTPESFRLDADVPHVVVEARHTKNKQVAQQPIPAALVADLRAFLARKRAGRLVWPIRRKDTAHMVRMDLKEAGVAVERNGEVVDMHGLRTTFGTLLARKNVPLALARNSCGTATRG